MGTLAGTATIPFLILPFPYLLYLHLAVEILYFPHIDQIIDFIHFFYHVGYIAVFYDQLINNLRF